MIKNRHFNDVQLTHNFNLREFESPDTGEVRIFLPLVEQLQEIRDLIREPLFVISGYRTPEHNATLKDGVKNSAHLYGLAADVRAATVPHHVVEGAAKVVGIPRIKVYDAIDGVRRGWVHLGYNTIPKKWEK